jgi:hypothetical protein
MHAQAPAGTVLACPRIWRVTPWITLVVTVWAVVAAGLLATAPSQTALDRQDLLAGAVLDGSDLRAAAAGPWSPGRNAGQGVNAGGQPNTNTTAKLHATPHATPHAAPTPPAVRPSARPTVVARH